MKMNIKELHAEFCQEAQFIRNFRPSTIRGYKDVLCIFLKHTPIQFVEEVTTDKLRIFLYEGRIKKEWTADTFLGYFKRLKSFFKWCVQRGYLLENPILPIEKPRLERKLPKRITKQEAQRLLEYAFNRHYTYRYERYRNTAVLGLMIYAGLRSGEALNLKMNEIDLKNGVISVMQGKGAKDRVVPICFPLQKILSDYLEDRKRLGRESIHFFTSIHGDTPFTYNGLKKVVENLKKGSGIRFSCHRLRHTFATLMLEGGCDLFSLQKMMGHSDIKTTTIYLSTTINHLQEQIRKHPMG